MSPKVEWSKKLDEQQHDFAVKWVHFRQTDKRLLHKLRWTPNARKGSCSRQCAYRRDIRRYSSPIARLTVFHNSSIAISSLSGKQRARPYWTFFAQYSLKLHDFVHVQIVWYVQCAAITRERVRS